MNVLLVVYDNGSYINHFPLGIAYVASYLRKYNHNVTIYSQDVYHYPDEYLTQYLNDSDFDIVGLGIIAGYYQYQKLLKLSIAINLSKKRNFFKYVLGGHGPTPDPMYFLQKTNADYVVLGEGEETIIDLLNNINDPRDVKGIAYYNYGNFINTGNRNNIKDIDQLPYPAYDLFPMEHYVLMKEPGLSKTDRSMVMLSGRGCIYQCNFCYRMAKGFRPRKTESIIDEIKYLQKQYYINSIIFTDELLMSSVKRTTEICEHIVKEKLNIKWWCNGRLNFAEKELLQLMRRAGCVFINYGIESMDDVALKIMNKNLTVDTIIKGVENTLAVGIHPGLNIIFGNIGENKDILKKDVTFLKKYGDGSQLRSIRPVTCYPGSPLYYYAIEKGLLKDVADFYENKHLNSDLLCVNFTDMKEENIYSELKTANIELIEDYYKKNKDNMIDQCVNLYENLDTSFRGFRQL